MKIKLMKNIKLLLICWALMAESSFAQQKLFLQFADALQSNMVLQQNKPFKVWGKAIAGQQVKIKADWISKDVVVTAEKDSSFLGIITMPVAKENDFRQHEMSIESNGERLLLNNLLIGDVWFCSGQSNMQFSMKEIKDSAIEVPAANYPNIRLFSAGLNFSASPINNINGKWVECSPKTVLNFSAVGYSFGKELYNNLHIPIGLVFSGIGASSAQAFVPQEVLAADTMLNRVYLQPYLNSDKSKEKIDGGFSFEKVTRPFLLYNAIIHPFINLSVKGFCWYQGESNRTERESYTRLTQALIKSWRQNFAQDNLPFYYVQVAPFYYDKEDPVLSDYAFFREAQENIATLNNTAMVLTMDIGEPKDIHPKNKKPVGIRLAKTALNRTYGRLEVNYQGPQYDYMEIKKTKIVIHFAKQTVAGGLQTNNSLALKHFEIASADKVFHPADAVIANETVVVSSSLVKKPVAVRYAFTNYPVTNFENKADFPAVPFRTDNWDEQTAR
jgi:sialate O-acetylesterase